MSFPIGFDQLRSWLQDGWGVEKGLYTFMIGTDSTTGQEIQLHVESSD